MTLIDIRRVRGEHVASTVASADFAVLPLGSVEWHGPHLPLGTDSLIAEATVGSLESGPWTGVGYPTVAFTSSPGQTRGYPGTIGIRPDTMVAYLSQVIEGILDTGFSRLLLLNAHDANMATARAAMEWVSGRRTASLLLANWFQLVPPSETAEIFGPVAARGHGGAFETAGALAAAPDAVSPSSAAELPPRPRLDVDAEFVLVESHPAPWDGWSGSPGLATSARAAEVADRAAGRLSRLVSTWLAAPPPEPPRPSR